MLPSHCTSVKFNPTLFLLLSAVSATHSQIHCHTINPCQVLYFHSLSSHKPATHNPFLPRYHTTEMPSLSAGHLKSCQNTYHSQAHTVKQGFMYQKGPFKITVDIKELQSYVGNEIKYTKLLL